MRFLAESFGGKPLNPTYEMLWYLAGDRHKYPGTSTSCLFRVAALPFTVVITKMCGE